MVVLLIVLRAGRRWPCAPRPRSKAEACPPRRSGADVARPERANQDTGRAKHLGVGFPSAVAACMRLPIEPPIAALGSPRRAALFIDAQDRPPHVGQHVVDLVEQLVRLVEPARVIGAAARLPMPVLPLGDAGEQAGDLRHRRHGCCNGRRP